MSMRDTLHLQQQNIDLASVDVLKVQILDPHGGVLKLQNPHISRMFAMSAMGSLEHRPHPLGVGSRMHGNICLHFR